jgi:hypothetical protein
LEILHTNDCSFDPSPCTKAKGFTVKAEYEESEGLGCSNKKEFDWFKQSGLDSFDENTKKKVFNEKPLFLPSHLS